MLISVDVLELQVGSACVVAALNLFLLVVRVDVNLWCLKSFDCYIGFATAV